MDNPFTKFADWLAEAKAEKSIAEPTAMTLATATRDGVPSARIVLLKDSGPNGFTFYTNYDSRKSAELIANPRASLGFYWMPLNKQVRIEGRIVKVSDAESDTYFASRARDRQIGAWASHQSQSLRDRQELEDRVREYEKKYEGLIVPRPPHWGGWRLTPTSIEFWLQHNDRLHERERFTRDGNAWTHTLLNP